MILAMSITLIDANPYQRQLYEAILSSLFNNTLPIHAFMDTESKALMKHSKRISIDEECTSQTDIIIGDHFPYLSYACRNKPLFATSYRSYMHNPNAFGAFYWRMGRPQIHFKKARLKRFHLIAPEELERFIDE